MYALAVLDALEIDRAVLLRRELVSGLTGLLVAATFPERVQALVLLNTTARVALGPRLSHRAT